MPERAKLHFTISSRSLSMRCESLWGKKSTEYSHLPSGDEWRKSSWWLTCAWWSSICLKTIKRRHKPSICYIRTWTNSTSESEQTRMSLTNSDDQKKVTSVQWKYHWQWTKLCVVRTTPTENTSNQQLSINLQGVSWVQQTKLQISQKLFMLSPWYFRQSFRSSLYT